MATVEVTITGDLADVVDQDFTQAQVKLRSNAGFIADRDADKIRILDERWEDVAVDGTFSFENVIASTDTIASGTLQYYVDIRVRLQREWHTVTLGPYVLTEDVSITDLEATQPAAVQRLEVSDVDADVLASSQDYTDDQIDAHEQAANPHPQYARLVDGNGNPITGGRLILVGAGGAFPAVEVGSVLIFGGF